MKELMDGYVGVKFKTILLGSEIDFNIDDIFSHFQKNCRLLKRHGTHNDIASMTGSVREVVSRTMSRLKKEGIIVDSNIKGFTIDTEKLSHLISKSDYPVT